MTDRRSIAELRALADKFGGYGHLIAHEMVDEIEQLRDPQPSPIPMFLTCPKCNARHIDEGEFATKPHHTHSCQSCGLTWRPAVEQTVGVEFLPGFKNEPTPQPDAPPRARRERAAMGDPDYEELEKLLANATPGKWKLWGGQVMADQDGTSNVDTAVPVAQTYALRTWDASLMCWIKNNGAEVIAAARAKLSTAEQALREAHDTIATMREQQDLGRGDPLVDSVAALQAAKRELDNMRAQFIRACKDATEERDFARRLLTERDCERRAHELTQARVRELESQLGVSK
jgi:hypothetical protein